MKKKTVYELLREIYVRNPTFLEKLLKERYGYAGGIVWQCLKASVKAYPIIHHLADRIKAEKSFRECFGYNFFTAAEGVREKKMNEIILKNFSDFANDLPLMEYIIRVSMEFGLPSKKAKLVEVV